MSTTTLNDTPEGAVTGDGGTGEAPPGDAGTPPQAGADGPAADPAGADGPAADPAGADGPAADPAGAGTAPTIDEMRLEIDAIDADLVRLIQRRTALSQAIGALRASEGGPRIVYSREMKILDRFAALGPAGTDLGMMLLSMGRGKMGRR